MDERDTVTLDQARDIIVRVTGVKGHVRSSRTVVSKVYNACWKVHPFRMEFEVMRTQGRAWDHEELTN